MKLKITISKSCLLALTVLAAGTTSANAATPAVWVSDSTGHLATVHASTGAVHDVGQIKVGGTSVVMTDIAISSTGIMYGVDGMSTTNSSLYQINPLTAAATYIGGLGTNVNSLVFGLDGKLYAANDSLWTVNTLTGSAFNKGNSGTVYHSDGDLAFLNGDLYLTGCTTAINLCGTSHLIKINTANGAGTDIGDTGYNQMYGLAADDTTLFAFSADTTSNFNNFLYKINPTTGNVAVLQGFNGDTIGPVYGAALAPVPEPETFAMLLAGLGVVASIARRRKVKQG